jgi:hypothetical protein
MTFELHSIVDKMAVCREDSVVWVMLSCTELPPSGGIGQ